MGDRVFRRIVTSPRAAALTALLVGIAVPASAHKTEGVGPLRLTIGWGDEPTFSGFKNTVEVAVSDAAGAPVTDAGTLTAEVSFGDQRIVLPLLPVGKRPGLYRAWLVPTRPGSYTFHITGTARGQAIDTTLTCSDATFDCVTNVSDIHFPAKDPSVGQLADRIDRSLPRAERAMDSAASARKVSIAAVAVAALALGTAIGLGLRRGKKSA